MYEAIVIGVSAGGMEALKKILPALVAGFPVPIVVVQHIAEESDSYMTEHLNQLSTVTVKEAEDKESLAPGTVYFAPPGYHLLIEDDHTFSLSADPRVNYSCPSIDVLFESAADVFGGRLIGVVLTGANCDGSAGLQKIKARGGLAIVQDPETAYVAYMPQAALETVKADYIVHLEQLAALLTRLTELSKQGDRYGTGTHRQNGRI